MTSQKKTIVIDFSELATLSEALKHIEKKMELPDNYGKNLDALYDGLTDISRATNIYLCKYSEFLKQNGKKGEYLMKVFADAEVRNKNLFVLHDVREI